MGHYQQPQQQDDWRQLQEEMLRQYLATAECDLRAKQELVDVKQQRLHLAQDEYQHLNSTLATLSASTTSCEYLCMTFKLVLVGVFIGVGW